METGVLNLVPMQILLHKSPKNRKLGGGDLMICLHILKTCVKEICKPYDPFAKPLHHVGV